MAGLYLLLLELLQSEDQEGRPNQLRYLKNEAGGVHREIHQLLQTKNRRGSVMIPRSLRRQRNGPGNLNMIHRRIQRNVEALAVHLNLR